MNIPLRQYTDLLAGYLRPQRTRVAALSVLLLASVALPLVGPQIIRVFIDRAIDGAPVETLVLIAVLFIVVALATQAFQVAATYFAEQVGWTATNLLRADLMMHTLRLDMPFHHTHTPGEMIERIDGDVTALSNFFSQFVMQIIGGGLLLVGVMVVATFIEWRVGLVISAFTLTALGVLIWIRNLAVKQATAERESDAQLFGFLEERLQGLDDIRTNGAGDYVMRRFYERGRDLYTTTQASQKASAWVWIAAMAVFSVGYALTLGMGAYLYLDGAITIGTVYLFFQYVQMLRRPMEMIAEQFKQFQKASAGVARVQQLRAIQSSRLDRRESAAGSRQSGGLVETNGRETYIPRFPIPDCRLPGGALAVRLDQVTFSYDGDEPVLREIGVELAPASVLGILGRTGSGKTTLTRLLLRLYDAQQGSIRLGDIDIRDLPLPELRRGVGIVTQDVQLFAATVRDNLTMFDEEIADSQIMDVLSGLGLLDWFWTLPNGLDTELASGGGGLSAGEAQLLAFARVFLRNPGLVILDEASSRLDPATERLIERAVDKLLAGRTGIIIAHRLGTVQRADLVLILDNGRVVEYGRRELLAADPASRFAALMRTGMEEVLV
ncbi:MAG: ABC transporter ATP-binding protein [Dehalococcoidia bacterium]